MKSKALAVLIPALFLATSAVAQTKEPAASDKSAVPSAEDRAKNREAVSDSTLTGKVKSALAADVGLKTVTSIHVDTDNGGVVTLKGNVTDAEMKKRAEAVAKKVEGVKSVKNQIQVTKG
jgi:hyperosmotically inducible periplasmic protein